MLRQILVTASVVFTAQLVYAGEAGKVIFVAGDAHIVERQAEAGAAVQEGELMRTGADGFIYIKTVDNGLFILRPNTEARITTYQVDANNPGNTRVKLDLLSGVARAKSGNAVKAARQNFRFNTPVAAIGVRGTDFTVFTDNNVTRVAVISGGVVVSGFGGACTPDGTGPCEGSASRELSAAQRGKLLQVQRGKPAPELMQAGPLAPDSVAPARPDEPGGKGEPVSGGLAAGGPILDAQKNDTLKQVVTQTVTPPEVPGVTPPVAPPPNPVSPPPVIVPPLVEVPPVVTEPASPPSGILWGRWQPLLGKPATLNLAAQTIKSQLVAVDGNFALFRTPGKEYVAAEKGSLSFNLRNSEAYVYTDVGTRRTVDLAVVTDGKLTVDFGQRTFATTLDMTSQAERFNFQAQGSITRDGLMFGDSSQSRRGYMDVKGVLSDEKGGTAAYIFSGKIDDRRSVNGATYWRQ